MRLDDWMALRRRKRRGFSTASFRQMPRGEWGLRATVATHKRPWPQRLSHLGEKPTSCPRGAACGRRILGVIGANSHISHKRTVCLECFDIFGSSSILETLKAAHSN
jgi:hypothetical protein